MVDEPSHTHYIWYKSRFPALFDQSAIAPVSVFRSPDWDGQPDLMKATMRGYGIVV